MAFGGSLKPERQYESFSFRKKGSSGGSNSVFWQAKSNFLETKLPFREGQVKPSTPGRILDPRRALLASNLFRKRKEKERIEGGKGERGEHKRERKGEEGDI